jgi:plastocyanin
MEVWAMPTHLISRAGKGSLALAVCALLVAAVTATTASAASSAHPLLVGQTGPGFTITLKQKGKPVKTLKPGVYTLKILDKSSIHNFHLTGPGVKKLTSVARVYTVTWTVTLKKGTYTFVCDPHRQIMHGTFKVT